MPGLIGSKFEVCSPPSKTGMAYLVPHVCSEDPSMPSRRAGSLSSSDDHFNDNYHDINSDEDSFTFSSVAGSMGFNFSSTACFAQAEAMKGPLCMSPADELFEDGKIRPLMQPINGHDRAVHLNHDFSMKPMLNQPLIGINHLNYGSRPDELLISPHNDAPDHSFQAKKLTDQSIISTHHGEINQGSRPESADQSRIMIHDGELNHRMGAKPIDQMVLSSDLNHRLRANVTDHTGIRSQEGDPNYGGLPLDYVSLPSPASPVRGIKANDDDINYTEEHAINNSSAVISTNHYKRSRSLSRFRRVFQIEEHEPIIEMQSEDVIKGVLQFEARSKQRRTLKDLLIQEESAMIKLAQARMIKKKKKPLQQQVGLETQSRLLSDDESVIKSLNLVRRQSLAPAPINIPQVWPIRDELLSPRRNSNAGGACPHLHERYYAAQRAQAERMKKKTFLPYRPGLLACLLMRSPSQYT